MRYAREGTVSLKALRTLSCLIANAALRTRMHSCFLGSLGSLNFWSKFVHSLVGLILRFSIFNLNVCVFLAITQVVAGMVATAADPKTIINFAQNAR